MLAEIQSEGLQMYENYSHKRKDMHLYVNMQSAYFRPE